MDNAAPVERTTVGASLNLALHGLMETDPRVVVIGEDILDPYGGAFKVTRGLSTRFPDRVFTTPISEAAIVGLSNGMALRGLRPVAEIMFGDFLTLAADQLINHAAKFRWMYNEQMRVPLVVRAPMGGRRGYGPTHSQCLEKHFLGVPGLWVVAPNVLSDPGELLRQAVIECADPTLFIESKACYGKVVQRGLPRMTVEMLADESAPFATSYLRHGDTPGSGDGLLCCYGGMTPFCVEAVRQLREKEGLSIDLAVFTQLSPVPVTHLERIFAGRNYAVCAYAEEASVMAGWSAELVAQLEELRSRTPGIPHFRHERIGASPIPVPSSRELEQEALPQVVDIVERIVDCF